MFRGRECVESLARLHHKQRNTAYALCLKGKAHAEMVEYQASASAFEQCRRVDPNGLETMEVYRCGASQLQIQSLLHTAQVHCSARILYPIPHTARPYSRLKTDVFSVFQTAPCCGTCAKKPSWRT
jgi:hypothetical protein